MGAGGGAWGAVAQGVTDIGKTVASGVAQLQAQKFTKKMMKNRFQWMVDDLRAAGLNPILAVRGGLSAQMGGSGIASFGGGGSAGTTALSAMKFASEIDVLRAQAEALRASAGKHTAETRNILTDPRKALSRTLLEPMLDPVRRQKIFKSLKLSVDEIKARPGLDDFFKDQWQSTADRWKRGFNQ